MVHQLNVQIAIRLREMGDLLEHQGEGGFRAQAYRSAASVLEQLREPVDEILSRAGRQGLIALPAIGPGIAAAVAEMCATGRWSALDRLTGKLDPEALLRTVPGIGPQLARRLHVELHVETLEDLERAAHDGRLDRLTGFGPKRLEAIRGSMSERLRFLKKRPAPGRSPGVRVLLTVDAAYRNKARRNELKLIAPRRFNPKGLAWLPVMHMHYKGWHFTALYSNTARAHQLNKSRDWVLIFATSNLESDWQCTVVTETRGALKGKRVVRGREAECARVYARAPLAQSAA